MFAFLFLNKEICRIDGGISQFDKHSNMREEKREFDAQLSNCCVDFRLGKRHDLFVNCVVTRQKDETQNHLSKPEIELQTWSTLSHLSTIKLFCIFVC